MFIVYSLLAVLLIGQLICLFVLYSKYSSSAEKAWKNKVLGSMQTINSTFKKEQSLHNSMERSKQREVEQLQAQALSRQLQNMSTTLLADYPGIGPSTVEKLLYAGFRTMDDIRSRSISIHGIGDKRLSDIRAGYQQLYQRASNTLGNPSTIEYRQLLQSIATIQQAFQENTKISEARLSAMNKVRELMHEADVAANKITFWGFIRGTNRSHLPDRLRNFGFPNLQATLEKAEARAKRQEVVQEPKPVQISKPIVTPKPVIQPVKSVPAPKPVQPPEKRPSTVEVTHQLDSKPKKADPPPKRPAVDPFQELLQSPVQVQQPVTLSKPVEPIPLQQADVAQELLEIAVELGYLIARADGRLAQTEQQMIEGYLDSRYRSDAAMHNKAMTLSAHFAKASISIHPLVQRIKKHCQADAINHLLAFAKEVAMAGNINEKKDLCYCDIGKRLGITLTSLQIIEIKGEVITESKAPKAERNVIPPQSKASTMDAKQTHLKALEIEPGLQISTDLIRRQFNKLAERFQSAKVTHLGAEFEQLAEQRYASAKLAAECLLLEWGEQLIIQEKPVEPIGIRDNKELEELFGV